MITGLTQEIHKVLESRKPARAFRSFRQSQGDTETYNALNVYLGDFPDGAKIKRVAAVLALPVYDLNSMADSSNDAVRRVSRLILLEGFSAVTEKVQLQKGLADSSAQIRSDAARLTGTGVDRTRIYNQLIRLIREDPDIRVRRASGKRLAESFADLYSVDFDGLPPLSRMLILDALEGHSRIDEERAENLLKEDDVETSFRAARCLLKWGTLENLFRSGGSEPVLLRAAESGVVDYLEEVSMTSENRSRALSLAEIAGRNDLVRCFKPELQDYSEIQPVTDFGDIESVVMDLQGLNEIDRHNRIAVMETESAVFRKSLEMVFPPPDADVSSAVLFEIAGAGKWKEWSGRVIEGLSSVDPDIRKSAVQTIAHISPENAVCVLSPMLSDPAERVRKAAARQLASLPASRGCPDLLEFISNEVDQEILEPVLEGIRSAGGAALAQFILSNQNETGVDVAGALLSRGIDSVGVELLADGIDDEEKTSQIMARAGAVAGESFVCAWRTLDANARKRLLPALRASGWAESVLCSLKSEHRAETRRLSDLISVLDPQERIYLFELVLERADGRGRRLIRRSMKSR